MLRKTAWLALLLAASPAAAFLFFRGTVDSRWTDKPVATSADEAAWGEADVDYETSVDVRAQNDGKNLYLRLTSDGVDGRTLMSGAFRQDVALWFLLPDGKTASWGILLPFGSLGTPSPGSWQRVDPDDAVMPKIAAQCVVKKGVTVSSAAMPDGVEIRLALSGKDSVYSLVVPLSQVKAKNGKILLDVVSSPVSNVVKRLVANWNKNTQHRGADNGRGARSDDDLDNAPVPDPLKIKLAVRLAGPPDAK